MENKYWVFGSQDSQDYDILVQVDKIESNIDVNADLCKDFEQKIYNLGANNSKVVNVNLVVIEEGFITKCYKGTKDETNNALHYTHGLHTQAYPNPIKGTLIRDVDLKLLRVLRCFLSYYSRGPLRPYIKAALKATVKEQVEVLDKIDFNNPIVGKEFSNVDIYKVFAFQIGQLLSLLEGREPESYTKNDIAKNYPLLKAFLYRENVRDLDILNKYKDYISRYIKVNLPYLKYDKEPTFEEQ